MSPSSQFPQIFERLKRLYQNVPGTQVAVDTPQGYSLNTQYSGRWKKELFLGAVQIQKNYVSFYLMPVYMYPDLLEGISPALKRRMQGKSCFNFRTLDEAVIEELGELVTRSLERVRAEGLLG